MNRKLFLANCPIVAIRLICFVVLSASWLAGQQRAEPKAADIVLHHGTILTVDANFPSAEAVAISGGKFTAVGRNDDVLKLAGPNTLAIDLKGRTVIPGLVDTHRHIHSEAMAYGRDLPEPQLAAYAVDWRGVRSKDDVLNQVRGIMDKYRFKHGEWISFEDKIGFTQMGANSATEAKIIMDDLNRWELDKVTPNNPAVFTIGIPDFNGVLVNSKAIDIIWAKYGNFIKQNGRYWIDSSGRPDGHLEPPVARIAKYLLPQPAPEVLAPLYKKNIEELNSMGITTVSTRLPQESVAAYKLLESRGEMNLRMGYGMEWIFGNVTDLKTGLKDLGKQMGTGTDHLWITSASPTAVDGARTRACTNQKRLVAYGAIDKWWPMGQCHTDIEFKGAAGKAAPITSNYFRDWIVESARNGVRMANIHVAGDRATGLFLDIVERIQKEMGPAATKGWGIDHCFLMNPDDFKRAARLGILFSCYLFHIEDASEIAQAYGDKVANTFLEPIQSMINAGVKVSFESDRPVYEWNDIGLTLTRKDKQGKVWGPQDRVDKSTALKMITRWASEYVMKEDKVGSIEAGKLADLAVLDRDYMSIPPEEVSKIQPQMTIIDGRIVFVHTKFAEEYNLKPAGAVVTTYQDITSQRGRSTYSSGG